MNTLKSDEFKKPIPQEKIKKYFDNCLTRKELISEYPYFLIDSNKDFYKRFIINNISSKSNDNRMDAIDLAIAINYYSKPFLGKLIDILYGKENYLTKLTILDYFYFLFKKIPKRRFILANEYTYLNGRFTILKIQSCLNLLLYKDQYESYNELYVLLQKGNSPSLFYRTVNFIVQTYSFSPSIKELRKEIVKKIDKTNLLNSNQKVELKLRLKKTRKNIVN